MDETATANRLAQLQSLKNQHKETRQRPGASQTPSLTSQATSSSSRTSSLSTPPAQSRDSSTPFHSSHFNANFTPPSGRILVADSSPIGTSSPPPLPTGRTWMPPVKASQYLPPKTSSNDPLMTSTMSGSDNKFASYAFQPQNRRPSTPPNASAPSSISNTAPSPESPEIMKAGQRKRKRFAQDDDDLHSDASHSPPENKSRLTRERPPSSSNDVAFQRFKMTQPIESDTRIKAAWSEAKCDTVAATKLLSSGSWKPKPAFIAQAIAKPSSQSTRILNDKEKAAAKEKQKQQSQSSAIYAARNHLKHAPQSPGPSSPPKQSIDLTTPSSPMTPLVPTRRAKKMVIASESEAESGDDDDSDEETSGIGPSRAIFWQSTVDYFNKATPEALQELTGCSIKQAQAIIGLKPFGSIDDLDAKLGQGRKKAGPAGISPRLIEECRRILAGYGKVDAALQDCESIGNKLKKMVDAWSPSSVGGKGKGKAKDTESANDGSINLVNMESLRKTAKDYVSSQPQLLPDDIQLKEYQLLGLNWLNLLYNEDHSCILADEMGLGKTIQVISFLALLKERGNKGPHLIIVPASTLENWCREFARFAPDITVQAYYAGKKERFYLQHDLLVGQRQDSETGWEVLLTTYTLAQTDGDRRFLRKFNWDCCVFDEGHVLKNRESQRYQQLMKIQSKWKLLLTGTPLQNNLQELVSLMNFVLPEQFEGLDDELKAVFKVKGDSKALLARERISRAKKMLTPFILRRRKDQVLKDLPKKTEYVEYCEMNNLQRSIYVDAMQRSRKTVYDLPPQLPDEEDKAPSKKKAKLNPKKDKIYLENSSNVLMDLRKASSHPMLFRTRFTDDILGAMTKQLLKEPEFKTRGAVYKLVKEDMTVMTDSELQVFCGQYKGLQKFSQEDTCFEDSGKIQTLLQLIGQYISQGRKVLIFSQFTQILNILDVVLKRRKIKFLMLTGATPVDTRQSLVDEFGEDDSIPIFLLSTKAGGMGINLTAASVVIIFDQDFNPHNDRQAQDRAYRIGQKRDVDVIKLVSKGTIEEDMLRLGQTKLALDHAVSSEDGDDRVTEEVMKVSLLTVLRRKFEGEDEVEVKEGKVVPKPTADIDVPMTDPKV